MVTGDKESVSVIIVNYNCGELLVECVRNVLGQAEQVIVFDNASTDDSIKNLLSAICNEPRLMVCESKFNLGFACGCNLANKYVRHDIILFLNPDCILMGGSLSSMVKVLDSSPTIGMVGGFLCNPDGTEQPGGRRAVPTPWRSFVRAFKLNRFESQLPLLFSDFCLHKQPLPDGPTEVEAISGALMLTKRSALQDVGQWDEAYFLHCEDLDLCMRFRLKGWRILFVPDAQVLHHHGYCSQGRPFFVEWHKHRGMMRFYRKFFKHQYPGILMWIVAIGVWLRFGLISVRNARCLMFSKLREMNG